MEDNDDVEDKDKIHFRRDFFQRILPTIAKYGLVRNSVFSPFCPIIVLELLLDFVNIQDDYQIESLTKDKFMKSTLEEFTKVCNEAKINVDCYNGSNYPMRVSTLIQWMRFIRREVRK